MLLTAADLGLAQWRATPASFEPGPWYAGRSPPRRRLPPATVRDLRLAGLQWHGRGPLPERLPPLGRPLPPAPQPGPPHRRPRRPGLQPPAAAPGGLVLRADQRRAPGRPLAADRGLPLPPGRRPGRGAHPDPSGSRRGRRARASAWRLAPAPAVGGRDPPRRGGAPGGVGGAARRRRPGGLPGRLYVDLVPGPGHRRAPGHAGDRAGSQGPGGRAAPRRRARRRSAPAWRRGSGPTGDRTCRGRCATSAPRGPGEPHPGGRLRQLLGVRVPGRGRPAGHRTRRRRLRPLPPARCHRPRPGALPGPASRTTRFERAGRGRSPTATPAPGPPWRGGRWRGLWTARSTSCWTCAAPPPGGDADPGRHLLPGLDGDGGRGAVAIEPVEGLFRAVPLPPGAQRVDLRYRPPSFWLGLGTTIGRAGHHRRCRVSRLRAASAPAGSRLPGAASQGALRATPPSRPAARPRPRGRAGPGA